MKIIADTWLTECLERPVYKVTLDTNSDADSPEDISRLKALQMGSVFMYAKVVPSEVRSVQFLESQGFRLVDTNISFEKSISAHHVPSDELEVCFACPEHETGAISVAFNNFVYSRFHLDPHIERPTANRLKAEWVRNFFRGQRGDAMVVALINGVVVGFNQLLYSPNSLLTIDLIATDRQYRRRGIARHMITYAEAHCSPFQRIRAGTQVSNVPSIRLYETMGFQMVGAEYVLHFHDQRNQS